MEKIKITVEQEEALKYFYQDGCRLSDFISCKDDYTEEDSYYPLQTFRPIEFSLLLNGYYEIEEPFETGDWAYNLKYGYFVKIESIGEKTVLYEHNNGITASGLKKEFVEQFEKVTESWKIALLNIGREEIKLQIGDMYIDKNNSLWRIDGNKFLNDHAISDFEEDNVKKYFPYELGIDL